VSALRGAGIEYVESRPYVPGDDVRSFDWNATARTGVPHVKQHRPERGRTVIAVLDGASTMRFGSQSRSKLDAAGEAIALLGTAALAVGDRFGLVRSDAGGYRELPPLRGELQLHRLFEALAADRGWESVTPALDATARAARLETRRRRGDVVFTFGDAREPDSGERAHASSEADRAAFASPDQRARRARVSPHRSVGEGIFVLCSDPGELRWPAAGSARVGVAHGVGASLLFDGDDELARARFERAARARVARVARAVRARGDDFVHFRTDVDPLRLWLHFFRSRVGGSASRAGGTGAS